MVIPVLQSPKAINILILSLDFSLALPFVGLLAEHVYFLNTECFRVIICLLPSLIVCIALENESTSLGYLEKNSTQFLTSCHSFLKIFVLTFKKEGESQDLKHFWKSYKVVQFFQGNSNILNMTDLEFQVCFSAI